MIAPVDYVIRFNITDFDVEADAACRADFMEASINLVLVHRVSYICAYVLLNLLKELRKSDKMRGLPSILSLFRYNFNKFNYIGARMLDSIYHMTLRLL